jgi:hypothetical protein
MLAPLKLAPVLAFVPAVVPAIPALVRGEHRSRAQAAQESGNGKRHRQLPPTGQP